MKNLLLSYLEKNQSIKHTNKQNCDDYNVWLNCLKLHVSANVLAGKFTICLVNVRIALFREFCIRLYTAHLQCSCRKATCRDLMWPITLEWDCLADGVVPSKCFKNAGVPTRSAVLRNLMSRYKCRQCASGNGIILAFANLEVSSVRLRSHWRSSLHVGAVWGVLSFPKKCFQKINIFRWDFQLNIETEHQHEQCPLPHAPDYTRKKKNKNTTTKTISLSS